MSTRKRSNNSSLPYVVPVDYVSRHISSRPLPWTNTKKNTKKPKTKTRFAFSVLGESDDPRTIGQPLAKKTISNFHCKKGREIENKTHKWSCFYLISYYRNKKAALIYASPSRKQDSLTLSKTKHEQSILKCALHAPCILPNE